MSLPAFASLDDLATRLPGGLDDADVPRAQAALDDASSEIRSVADQTWETPPEDPAWAADALMRICCAAARRSFTNPDGVSQESLGEYSVTQTDSSSDVYLTAAEKRTIARITGNATRIWTLSTTRGPIETRSVSRCGTGTEYLPVEGGADIPFSGPDGY